MNQKLTDRSLPCGHEKKYFYFHPALVGSSRFRCGKCDDPNRNTRAMQELDGVKTDREISHMIATELLGWAYAESSDTYWLEFGVELGIATSFNPLTDEFQGNKVISTLELPCTRENLKEYVLSLTDEQKKEMRGKYGPIQREQAGIKYHSFRNGKWEPISA